MQLWRLVSPKSAEPMSHFESEGWKAAVEAGKVNVPVWKLSGRRILSCSREDQPFVLFKPSADPMRPIYIMEVNLLYRSTNFNVTLIQKYLHRNTQDNVWPIIWAFHGLVKLTHKIKHHRNHRRKYMWSGLDEYQGQCKQGINPRAENMVCHPLISHTFTTHLL